MATNGPYDVFGPQFGLGLPFDWFASSEIETLLTAPLTGSSVIDRLQIGWDGDTTKAFDAIRTMLRAGGYFPAYTATGHASFGRMRLASVLDIGNVETVAPLPQTLRRVPAVGDGVDRAKGVYGEMPWKSGVPVEVSLLSVDALLDTSGRSSIFAESNVIEFDLSVLSPLAPDDAAFALYALVAMMALALDTVHIRAQDPGTIGLGDIVKLGDPRLQKAWFTDVDGASIEVDSSPRWYGQVQGFRRDLLDGSIDLEIRANPNEFERVRAPCAIVASVASAVYTCDEGEFLGPFGGGTDVEQFTVGDYVELWTQDGARRSGTSGAPDVQQIDGVGTNTLTLDAAFSTSAEVGDIIRVAHLSTADGQPENDSALVDGYVPWVYSADGDGLLGPGDGPAHIYGYGTI